MQGHFSPALSNCFRDFPSLPPENRQPEEEAEIPETMLSAFSSFSSALDPNPHEGETIV